MLVTIVCFQEGAVPERPVPEVHSLVGFMYDLKLVPSASSNYHALSLVHSKFHCPRSCFAVFTLVFLLPLIFSSLLSP